MAEKDIWADDLLGRKDDAEYIYNFLVGQTAKRQQQKLPASYVLNIDAEWGAGKTFFLERFTKHLEAKGHLVARVNAWKDDNATDPLVAILAAVDETFAPYLKTSEKRRRAWRQTTGVAFKILDITVRGALKTAAKNRLGLDTEALAGEIAEYLRGTGVEATDVSGAIDAGIDAATAATEDVVDEYMKDLLADFIAAKEATDTFAQKMAKSVEAMSQGSKKSPMFVVVDELDRCKPTFAIQMLERVKHIFNADGVVFIFATNSTQLRHSISGVYGANFDGYRYLKRFFDRTYLLPKPDTTNLVKALWAKVPRNKIRQHKYVDIEQAVVKLCEIHNLEARDIERVIDHANVVATAWTEELPVEIGLLIPLCVSFEVYGKIEEQKMQSEIGRWVVEVPGSVQNMADNYRTVAMGEVYSLLSGQRNLDRIFPEVDKRSESATKEYTRNLLLPEVAEKTLKRLTYPSVQSKLFHLVEQAGRMRSEADAAE